MMTDVKEFFDYTRTSQAWHLADNASATNAWAMTAYYTPYNASGDATGITAGQWYYGLAPTTVTSTLTLAVNGGAAKAVLFNNAALATGIITSGDPMQLWYDGTSFHIVLINRIAKQLVAQLALDGTASAPAYSFASDTNTGIYWIGADALGISTGGTLQLRVDTVGVKSTLPVLLPDGSAAAPSIGFTAQTDLGLYRAASNTLGLATAGTLRRSISTMAETNTLPQQGQDGDATIPAYSFSADTDTGVYRVGANSLGVTVGGTVRKTLSTTTETNTLLQLGADGDATTPGYGFSGDTNTGIYRIGADQIGITTGGTLRKTISTTAVTNTLPLLGADGAVSAPQYSFSGDTDNGLYRIGANNPGIAAGGSLVHNLSADGNLQPLQPSFRSYLAADATDATGDGTVYVLGTSTNSNDDHDQGSDHSLHGIFTAPVTGIYLFGCKIRIDGLLITHTSCELDLVWSSGPTTFPLWYGNPFAVSVGGIFMTSVSMLLKMAAAQTVDFRLTVSGGTKVVDVLTGNARTTWWGQLVA